MTLLKDNLLRLIFRANASSVIGSGHVMRCASLIETAVGLNIPCVFIGDLGDRNWLKEVIFNSGALYLNSISELGSPNADDILVIDSYENSIHDEAKSRSWKYIVNISDGLPFRLDCDLIIYPHLGETYIGGPKPRIVSGKDFIPFRSSIMKISRPQLANPISKLVVFGGGTDVFEFGYEIARTLTKISFFDSAKFFSSDKHRIENLDSRFSVLEIGRGLDEILNDADLVVTTSSTSSLEVIARELPLAVLSVVGNQESNFEYISSKGIGLGVGHRTGKGLWKIDLDLLSRLFTDLDLRLQIARNQKDFLPLNGADNIIREILELHD
jgi:spore coat polysaccharide biosynthesis predicted glycosyltransferase SpsG